VLFLLGALGAAYTFGDRILGLGPLVETATVVRSGGSEERAVLVANGYVTARRQAGVTAKVTGRIAKLYRDLGERVSAGELLAELEIGDLLAAREEIQATLWLNELEAQRAKELAEKNVGSRAEYDLALARARETAARLKNVEEQIENTKVRAPFDGMIIVKNGEVGETVSLFGAQTARKSGPIFVIADFREFEVECDVNEANISKVREDGPAEIVLDAVGERRYEGRVRQIVPTADRQKATIMVKVSLLDPDRLVYPEMSARVTFLLPGEPAAPSLVTAPAEGIVERAGRKVALVVRGDRVLEVAVETRPVADGRVVVQSGLSGGESIVLSPPPDLADGGRVRLRGPQ
jgi:RND family efflux transporter MFP subunit